MNLKSKLFGTLTASAIALSMSLGIASASTSDSETVSVTLAPAASCSVYINSMTGSFGTWFYNGVTDEYTKPSNTRVNFSGELVETEPGGSCAFQLKFAGLENGSERIGPENFSAGVGTHNLNALPAGVGSGMLIPGGLEGAPYTGYLELNQIPDSAQDWEPETYEGTVTVTTGAGLS